MWDLLLTSLGKYVNLTTDDRDRIRELFEVKKFRRHQYILQEGEMAKYEIFIVKGLTRTYEIDATGREHILQFGLEGWWIGDLFSFLTENPTRYNIDCLEDTEVLRIDKQRLELLYEQVPKMERHFRIIIQNAFIATTSRVASALTKNAGERYQEFLQQYPQIEQRVPDRHVASYLGITAQSLSRIRAGRNS